MLVIDHESKLPLYYQLREELRKTILSGELKEGEMVPSERELSEKYDLSSTTVRRALHDLVIEDLLDRKPGKGTFVRARKVKRDLKKVLGFTQNMKEMGLTPTTKVLSKKIMNANEFAREKLGLEQGAKILRLNRLRLANNTPMMLETRYVRLDLCPGIEEKDLNSSLWRVFEFDYDNKPYRHSRTLGIVTVSGRSRELLGLKLGEPVFLIKGVTYLRGGQPIECEESLYRSDKYELTFEAVAE